MILKMSNILGKVVEKTKPQILSSITFFSPKNRAVDEIMWKNTEETHRPQLTR